MAVNIQGLNEGRLEPVLPMLRQGGTSAPGDLNYRLSSRRLTCLACVQRCVIPPGESGNCRFRYNDDGVLRVPFGYVTRRFVTSIETHSLFHVLPGARALTFEVLAAEMGEPARSDRPVARASEGHSDAGIAVPVRLAAEQLVDEAVAFGARVLCAAGDEPMVAAEWVKSVFGAAHRRGLRTAILSGGRWTGEALRYLRDDTDVLRVDLVELGGRMEPVLDAIGTARELGYWVEVATRVVPGLNQDLRAIAHIGRRIRGIGGSIPWHLNAVVPRDGEEATSSSFLALAAGAAELAGQKFAYVASGVAGGQLADTRCAQCRRILVARGERGRVEVHFRHGACPGCSAPVPGVWT